MSISETVDKVTLFALLNALPKEIGIVHWNKRQDYKRHPFLQAEETVHGRRVKQHTKKVPYVLILMGSRHKCSLPNLLLQRMWQIAILRNLND
jgi:hypothetical protein